MSNMMRRSYILTVLAIFALLVTVSLQGCLFGGGDDASGGGEEGGAPAGDEMMGGGEEGGAPDAGGMPGGDEMMGGGEGGEMPSEDMGMGGEEMGDAPAAASGGTAALSVKHGGDWSGAAAQCEAALAANPDDAEAHRVLAWILADTDAAGAIEHFNAYLASGAEGNDAEEAKAAIERLQ